jgi:hypothetical protein
MKYLRLVGRKSGPSAYGDVEKVCMNSGSARVTMCAAYLLNAGLRLQSKEIDLAEMHKNFALE